MISRTVLLGFFVIACGGGEPVKPASSAAPAAAATKATDKSVSQNTEKTASDAPRIAAPLVSSQASRTGAGPVPGPIDPPWFRKELFPGATVATSGRTQRDEAGLFSTQMLFALAEGTTQAACLETVKTALASAVPELAREDGKDGRVTLTGKTDDYSVIAICGEAKGKPTAYVSYAWLKAPAIPASAPAQSP